MTDRCPNCQRRYEWVTTGPFGIGTIRPVHPVGKCEPPKPVVYEPEEENIGDAPPRTCKKGGPLRVPVTKVCNWPPCGKTFTTYYQAKKTCSPECGGDRYRAYWREYFKKGAPRVRKKKLRAAEFDGELRKYLKRKVA